MDLVTVIYAARRDPPDCFAPHNCCCAGMMTALMRRSNMRRGGAQLREPSPAPRGGAADDDVLATDDCDSADSSSPRRSGPQALRRGRIVKGSKVRMHSGPCNVNARTLCSTAARRSVMKYRHGRVTSRYGTHADQHLIAPQMGDRQRRHVTLQHCMRAEQPLRAYWMSTRCGAADAAPT